MKMLKLLILFLYCTAIIFRTHSAIAQGNIESNYKAGINFFNKGEYKSASHYFNAALKSGMTKPALYYNLGATYYKLKDYESSKRYFYKLTRDKSYRGLAYYNLGLIYNQLGDNEESIKNFSLCKRNTNDRKLANLASKQISILKKSISKEIRGSIILSYGRNSNITASPVATGTNVSGSFQRIYASLNKDIYSENDKDLVIYASAFKNDYIDTDIYDDDYVKLGTGFRHGFFGWRFYYDADIRELTYGDADYQRINRLAFKIRKKTSNKYDFFIRASHESIDSLSPIYNYLEGDRNRYRIGVKIPLSNDRLGLEYELEENDRLNTPTLNYSPTRNKYLISYDKYLYQGGSLLSEIYYRSSDYEFTPTQQRLDDRVGIKLKYAHSFGSGWLITASASHKNNDSTYPPSNYTQTVTDISLGKYF